MQVSKRSLLKITLLIFLGFTFQVVVAQKRVVPGALYQPGDSLYGPRIGAYAKMPEGWMGVLPENTEVFLLAPANNAIGQIYIVDNPVTQEKLLQGWQEGFNLADGVDLVLDSEVTMRNGRPSAKIRATNSSEYIGYVEAICGDYNFCLTAFMVTTHEFYDDLKDGIVKFMDNCRLDEPYEKDIYADLDWTVFLANKTLTSYEYEPGSKVVNEVTLCENMTFRTRIRRKGALVKGDIKEYQGNKKGTWSMSNKGPQSTLTLTFDKVPPIQVPVRIDDEKIFINEKRYFVLMAESCK